MRREQTRVQELQQQLEQERALSLRKDREEEERREVRRGLKHAYIWGISAFLFDRKAEI